MSAARSLSVFSKSWRFTALAIVMFLYFSMSAFAEDAKSSEGASCELIKPPTTPTELLKNVKCVVALDLISDKDFFTNDEKLWELFGGQQFFRRFPRTPRDESVDLTNFPPSIYDYKVHNGRTDFPLSIEVIKYLVPVHHRYETSIRLSSATGLKLNFDDITRMFGFNWRPHDNSRTIYEPLHPGQHAPARTNIHSFQDIDYTLELSPKFPVQATIGFDSAGIFSSLEMTILKKE